MAARRLILVMLFLLVLSSAVAALIPVERDALDGSSSSTTTTTAPEPPATGELVKHRLDAQAKKPETIRIAKGDQLELTVSSTEPGQVEIAALGVLEDVDRFFPAHLDLLPADQGTYPVRLVPDEPAGDLGRVIGRIEVRGAT